MSHQRYPSHDTVKEPHSVSLKVLRLSRPSLVAQYPIQPPFSSSTHPPPMPASLAYSSSSSSSSSFSPSNTNPAPFVLSPILNLPPSFGSAYVGETFSCTLCANLDLPENEAAPPPGGGGSSQQPKKSIRDVRIEAEMKTPSSAAPIKLALLPPSTSGGGAGAGVDLGDGDGPDGPDGPGGGAGAGGTSSLQRILAFDLKEEGNHVLAVTVSYYEATALSGRTRTFRKLYQFICKPSLIVRTKPGVLASAPAGGEGDAAGRGGRRKRRRWVLEAQLENCSEEGVLLERVGMEMEEGLGYEVVHGWGGGGFADGGGDEEGEAGIRRRTRKPVLQPGETEQVCFLIQEEDRPEPVPEQDGRVVFGVLQIGWRSEMGNRGFLSTGKLGTRLVKAR